MMTFARQKRILLGLLALLAPIPLPFNEVVSWPVVAAYVVGVLVFLRRVMEDAAGQDLSWFFRQWLRRPGSPAVEGTWRYDAAGKRVEIELAQVQPGEPYRLPLEVGLSGDGAAPPRVVKVEMTRAKQRFDITAETEPAAVVLDPNTWVLMQASFNKR